MRLDFNDILFAFSDGLDCVELGLSGETNHHSKRVAYMASRMGKVSNMNPQHITDLAGCALLHDNALTEYLLEEYSVKPRNGDDGRKLCSHCIIGEKNIKNIPFHSDVNEYILYHHENANGTGPFQKTSEETPIGAQIIHLADTLDLCFQLDQITEEKWDNIKKYLEKQTKQEFSEQVVGFFMSAFSYEKLKLLSRENLMDALAEEFPEDSREYSDSQIFDFCNMFAMIIDYKSEFTSRHSLGIAQKAQAMGEYYGYGKETLTKLYFTGAVHDIGKLTVETEVLEKPDKLTQREYQHIKNHAMGTYAILSQIRGIDEMVGWASFHHEKLNGSGYPFGLTGDKLGNMERLMACLDIYQALTEERPYRESMPHNKAMEILKSMAEKGEVDGKILLDMDIAFGK